MDELRDQELEILEVLEDSNETNMTEDNESGSAGAVVLVVGVVAALAVGAYFGGKKLVKWFKNRKSGDVEEIINTDEIDYSEDFEEGKE